MTTLDTLKYDLQVEHGDDHTLMSAVLLYVSNCKGSSSIMTLVLLVFYVMHCSLGPSLYHHHLVSYRRETEEDCIFLESMLFLSFKGAKSDCLYHKIIIYGKNQSS